MQKQTMKSKTRINSIARELDYKLCSLFNTLGEGAIQANSSKQKLNTRSSCDAELVGNDDAATKILWTRYFMEAQGYKVRQNIVYQDNKSTIQLLKNGRRSAGK